MPSRMRRRQSGCARQRAHTKLAAVFLLDAVHSLSLTRDPVRCARVAQDPSRSAAVNIVYDRANSKMDLTPLAGKEAAPIITHCGGGGRGQKVRYSRDRDAAHPRAMALSHTAVRAHPRRALHRQKITSSPMALPTCSTAEGPRTRSAGRCLVPSDPRIVEPQSCGARRGGRGVASGVRGGRRRAPGSSGAGSRAG